MKMHEGWGYSLSLDAVVLIPCYIGVSCRELCQEMKRGLPYMAKSGYKATALTVLCCESRFIFDVDMLIVTFKFLPCLTAHEKHPSTLRRIPI